MGILRELATQPLLSSIKVYLNGDNKVKLSDILAGADARICSLEQQLQNRKEEKEGYKELFRERALEVSTLTQQNGEMLNTLKEITKNPYPEDIFLPISDEEWNKIRNFCKTELHFEIDRLSGNYGRIFHKIFSDMAQQTILKIDSLKGGKEE